MLLKGLRQSIPRRAWIVLGQHEMLRCQTCGITRRASNVKLTDASLVQVRRGAPTAELSVAKEQKKPSRERRGDSSTNSSPPNSVRMGYQVQT